MASKQLSKILCLLITLCQLVDVSHSLGQTHATEGDSSQEITSSGELHVPLMRREKRTADSAPAAAVQSWISSLLVKAAASAESHEAQAPHTTVNITNNINDTSALLMLPGDTVAFYSTYSKRFLRMRTDGGVDASATLETIDDLPAAWGWERFTVVDASSGQLAFHNAAQNRFLRMRADGIVEGSFPKGPTELPADWKFERFAEVQGGNESIAIFSIANSRFVRMRPDGIVDASALRLADSLPSDWTWERFTVQRVRPAVLRTQAPFANASDFLKVAMEIRSTAEELARSADKARLAEAKVLQAKKAQLKQIRRARAIIINQSKPAVVNNSRNESKIVQDIQDTADEIRAAAAGTKLLAEEAAVEQVRQGRRMIRRMIRHRMGNISKRRRKLSKQTGIQSCEGRNLTESECKAISCCTFDAINKTCFSAVGTFMCNRQRTANRLTGVEVCEGKNIDAVLCASMPCCRFNYEQLECKSRIGNRRCPFPNAQSKIAAEVMNASESSTPDASQTASNASAPLRRRAPKDAARLDTLGGRKQDPTADLLNPKWTAADQRAVDKAVGAATESEAEAARKGRREDPPMAPGIIALIVISCIVLVAALGGFVWWYLRDQPKEGVMPLVEDDDETVNLVSDDQATFETYESPPADS